MSFLSRRNFVVRSAALLPAAKLLVADALTANNLGVQLYTVRSTIGADPAGVLKAIQDLAIAKQKPLTATSIRSGPLSKKRSLSRLAFI